MPLMYNVGYKTEREVQMAVITISRQMGSLGFHVAEEIALNKNYRLVWREVINEAATRAGVPEVALATIDELDLLGLRPSVADHKAYHKAVSEIMKELAEEGDIVIVGRAGQVILRDMPRVLHAQVYAPFELRAERIALRHAVSIAAAREQVKTSDQSRTRYLKRFYHSRWDDPDLYDLMINSALLSSQGAASVVCQALKAKLAGDKFGEGAAKTPGRNIPVE